MVAFTRGLAVGLLVAGAAAAIAHERFVAVETGVILSPRQYYKDAMSPAQPLRKRQDGCHPGQHPCDDIGLPGVGSCCFNTDYCIVDPSDPSKSGCCRIGQLCKSPCPATAYQCPGNTTVLTLSGGTTSTSTSPACCGRVCTQTSQFQCPSAGCCSYGQRCGANGQCLFTPPPSTTTPTISLAPPGCTTGEISCAVSVGGGCCAATQSCTLIDDKAHCAENPVTPSGSGVSVVSVGDESGLGSAGAKAGVAVGVVVGCGLLIGAVTWWCLRRRRAERRRTGRASEGGGGEDRGGEDRGGGGDSSFGRSAGVVGRVVGGGAEMSDGNTSDMMSRTTGGRRRGLTQDYFGPAPAVGPYSETHATSAATTPGLDRGGVPLQPHEPGDIAVPVEIDSMLREERKAPPVGLAITPAASTSPVGNAGEARFELYGSEVGQISPTLPSPYAGGMPSPDERARQY
ncbi:hypothetical protein C8A00DRAFT_17153 [Chaetomidium leptoderma]|uniref:Uncharacterized protein n=1 Tax=Chaetomidium leptoderma TaxID=669021 RepID=A0AAN6VJN7_9PEZI|nr:hypothetical protein C8A00DRAFT_17153 [Chaetomidium leptoderma]